MEDLLRKVLKTKGERSSGVGGTAGPILVEGQHSYPIANRLRGSQGNDAADLIAAANEAS